jgi:hypothetical protein
MPDASWSWMPEISGRICSSSAGSTDWSLSSAMILDQSYSPTSIDKLTTAIGATVEGAFIMSKTLKEPKLVATQIALYRDFVELLFADD